MVPFVSLTMEKTAYDTFQAFRGHDIYTRGVAEGARGGFPSGGSELPSFALIPVQSWKLETGSVAHTENGKNVNDSDSGAVIRTSQGQANSEDKDHGKER